MPRRPHHPASARAPALGLLLALALPALPACAATMLVCRTFDLAAPVMSALLVPADSIFRDNGRADDPLAAYGNDRWQLRLATNVDVTISPLNECAQVAVRILSDSSVKAVGPSDNRALVYAGSYSMLERPDAPEELLGLRGRVLDVVH